MNKISEVATSDAFWVRTLFVIGYFMVYRILDLVLLLLTVVQWGYQLFNAQPHPALCHFGDSLGTYVAQIIHFLSGASDEKPFPFSDWPDHK